MVADQPERAVAVEQAAVEGDDAGRLLAAVLERVQAEHGVRGRGVVAEDPEHAAFLAQLVVAPTSGHCPATSRPLRPDRSPWSRASLLLRATSSGTKRRSRPAPCST
jgi:hypothetical protein